MNVNDSSSLYRIRYAVGNHEENVEQSRIKATTLSSRNRSGSNQQVQASNTIQRDLPPTQPMNPPTNRTTPYQTFQQIMKESRRMKPSSSLA